MCVSWRQRQAPGRAGPLDAGFLSFCAPRVLQRAKKEGAVAGGSGGAVDTAGQAGALRAEPGRSAPGLPGAQVSSLPGSTQQESPNTSATAEAGPGDGPIVRSKGWPQWPVIQRPWPLIPPSLGPPVTSGQSWTRLNSNKSCRGDPLAPRQAGVQGRTAADSRNSPSSCQLLAVGVDLGGQPSKHPRFL